MPGRSESLKASGIGLRLLHLLMHNRQQDDLSFPENNDLDICRDGYEVV